MGRVGTGYTKPDLSLTARNTGNPKTKMCRQPKKTHREGRKVRLRKRTKELGTR